MAWRLRGPVSSNHAQFLAPPLRRAFISIQIPLLPHFVPNFSNLFQVNVPENRVDAKLLRHIETLGVTRIGRRRPKRVPQVYEKPKAVSEIVSR
eukprot:1322013-Amorphochlora_amoeboformis.AAC.1